MRRTLTLCRTGLAGVAAFALLTACGGGSDGSASSSSASETTSSSAAESSSGGDASSSEFCRQAADLENQLGGIGNVSDPAQFGPALQQLAEHLKTIEPPAKIASDWDALVDAVGQLAQAAATTNFSDPQQAARFTQTANEIEQQLGTSSTNVQNYLQDECGFGTESSAPTS